MDRFRTGEMPPAAPAFAGLLGLAAAMIVQDGMQQAVARPAGHELHFGLGLLLVPLGGLSLLAFGAVVWAIRTERPRTAFITALAAAATVVLLLVAAGQVYTIAAACFPARACDAPPYPALQSHVGLGMVLLVVDLVAAMLVSLNMLDRVRQAPVLPPASESASMTAHIDTTTFREREM